MTPREKWFIGTVLALFTVSAILFFVALRPARSQPLPEYTIKLRIEQLQLLGNAFTDAEHARRRLMADIDAQIMAQNAEAAQKNAPLAEKPAEPAK